MEDKVIICQCGEEFVWTKGEQEFYKEKELSEPCRCKKCRLERKKKLQDRKHGKRSNLEGVL